MRFGQPISADGRRVQGHPSTKPGVRAPHFATTVHVCRPVIIQGQGRDSTYIYTDPGVTAFIDGEAETSATGEDVEFPVYRGFSINSSGDESMYKNQFYDQCMVVGGQYTSGSTWNSSAFGGVLSGPWNNIVLGNSAAFLPGVTTPMTVFPAAPDVHLYHLSSSEEQSAHAASNTDSATFNTLDDSDPPGHPMHRQIHSLLTRRSGLKTD